MCTQTLVKIKLNMATENIQYYSETNYNVQHVPQLLCSSGRDTNMWLIRNDSSRYLKLESVRWLNVVDHGHRCVFSRQFCGFSHEWCLPRWAHEDVVYLALTMATAVTSAYTHVAEVS